MILRWLFAALHLLALGIGLGAIWARARGLRRISEATALPRVFHADSLWGAAAALWIGTGLYRAFGGLEKGSDYYLHNSAFHLKMGLLVLVLALEVWPMVTLIRWRVAVRKGQAIDLRKAPALARVSTIQAVIIVLMVFVASAMARGIGL